MIDPHENVIELIKNRRSVRLFDDHKISDKEIIEIIEAGIWAPTGCNNQEIRFLIVNEDKDKEIVRAFKPFFQGTFTFILVFYDTSLPRSVMYKNNNFSKRLPFVDTGLALSNMMIYARSIGVDSCLFNLSEYHFAKVGNNYSKPQKIIRKIKKKTGLIHSLPDNFEFTLRNRLGVPEKYKITCGIALGHARIYPDVEKLMHAGDPIKRKPVDYYIISKKASRQDEGL